MPFITIFTPTYNRKNTLYRLYESLTMQSFKDFEWLIVDDGSSDNTVNNVAQWKESSELTIHYVQQPNSGKHVAYNNGLKLALGQYFFCVDSDDWLPVDAIKKIHDALVSKPQHAIGVIGQKVLDSGILLSLELPAGLLCTLFELSERYKYCGEWSIIYQTEIARRFRFPVIEGEKFSTESIVYDALSRNNYQLLVVNQTFTICEYQENGLSRTNPYKTLLSNPGCYKIYYGNRIDMALTFSHRVKNIVRYWAFALMFGRHDYDYRGKHLILAFLMLPFGLVAWIYYLSRKA